MPPAISTMVKEIMYHINLDFATVYANGLQQFLDFGQETWS